MTTNELVEIVLRDPAVRIGVARESFEWFFNIYLNKFMTHQTAPFQKMIFGMAENEDKSLSIIVSFRGSAKTTIMSLAYPIWSILSKQQKKFVVIIGETQQQSQLRLANIKRQFEQNLLLKKELGPFQEECNQWGATSLVIPRYGARIIAASREQSIRGVTHDANRPDLIVVDDVESLESVKTKEMRDKVFQWFCGDIIPAGDSNTKIIVIGNLLHEDGLIMRLKRSIDEGKREAKFVAIPLLNVNNEILWPGKFPNNEAIEMERKKIGNDVAWMREYLLKIIPDEGQIVHSDWIRYYDELPDITNKDFRYIATGIDPAIAGGDKACKTAMVSARVYGYNKEMRVYILPNPINERLTSLETIDKAKALSTALASGNHPTSLYVEEVAYQKSLVEQLKKEGIPAEGVTVYGHDKAERLKLVSFMIQSGQILFPKNGAEELIQQITKFGVERYDDLADAFSLLLHKIMGNNKPKPPHIKHNLRARDFYDRGYNLKNLDSGRGWRRLYG